MLSGAFPTLKSLEFSVGSPPANSESLNWEIISRRPVRSGDKPVRCAEKSGYLRMEKTRTMPSMVTLTTRSPSSEEPPLISCTPMFTVVCWPKRTIFVPARQSQHTRALSAPAETRFFEDKATGYRVSCQWKDSIQRHTPARMPFRCPASCCRGQNVTEEKR